MNRKLVTDIRKSWSDKSTEELLEIWRENNRDRYSNSAFEAAKEILIERGINLPEQKPEDARDKPSRRRCDKCLNERNDVRKYAFIYGSYKGSRYRCSSWFFGITHINTMSYAIYGTDTAWICDKCISQQRLRNLEYLGSIVLIWIVTLLGFLPLLDRIIDEHWFLYIPYTIVFIFSIVLICFFPELMRGLLGSKEALGDRIAIKLRRARKGYDAFFTRSLSE